MDTNTDIVKILEILPSDIISESMRKINYNFNAIASKSDVTDYKLLSWAQRLKDRLDEIERGGASRDNDLARGIDSLNDKMDNMDITDDIKNSIDLALAEANIDIQNFIISHIEDTVSHKYGDYVTNSYYQRDKDEMNGRIDGLSGDLDNVNREVLRISSAFDEWQTDAVTGTASASRIVANATFYKTDNDYFVNDDGTESVYKTLEDWYNNGGIKSEVDPENKGLDDDLVVQRLIQKAKQTFRTIYKEMSQIKQWIEENAAGFDIVASVRGEIGEVTAAIFGEATKEGSTIKMWADQLQFAANHRMILETGLFKINSTNLNVDFDGNVSMKGNLTANTLNTNTGNTTIDSDGNLTTINANITGDLTATTLNAAYGNTKIDSDGVLYATGAKISGDITAKEFQATDIVDVNSTSGYSGTITKTTIINGSTFNISADGSLSNGSDTRNVTGNQLYIKILDELDNTGANSEIQDTTMYGVPTLCMRYIDASGTPHEYVLNPNTWKDINSTSQGDPSDMRWLRQYNTSVLKYEPNTYRLNASGDEYHHYKTTLSSYLPGTLYMFSPDNRTTFMTGVNDTDDVYRLYVYNLGKDDSVKSTNLANLKSRGLVENSSNVNIEDLVYLNEHTVYALKSKIENNGGSSYLGPSVSQTRIPEVIDTYPMYLQDTIDCGVKLYFMNEFTSLTESYGLQHLYDFMVYALGGVKTGNGSVVNNRWKISGVEPNMTDFIDADISSTYQGLVGNLPFSTGGYYTSNENYIYNPAIELKINAYPKINITENGKTVGEYTNYIYANCSVEMSCDHYVENSSTKRENTSEISNAPIRFGYQKYNYNTMNYDGYEGEFIPRSINVKLEFDFICSLSGNGIQFNPLDPKARSGANGEDNIMNRIYSFLKTFNFKDNIKNKKGAVGTSNVYPEHAKLTATIEGLSKTSASYNGYQTNAAILKKTTIL